MMARKNALLVSHALVILVQMSTCSSFRLHQKPRKPAVMLGTDPDAEYHMALAQKDEQQRRSNGTGSSSIPQASGNHYRYDSGVGSWGGICTCPDGQRYEVGDNYWTGSEIKSCWSLACEGGVAGPCSEGGIGLGSVGMKVTCAATPAPTCEKCYAPPGAATCVSIDDDSVQCSGCIPNGNMCKDADSYVPGQPGAGWTEMEMLVVRAKIRAVLSDGGAAFGALGVPYPPEFYTSVPGAGKILRLGFHDCLPYKDGLNSSGCDGCLDWDGVGQRYDRGTLGYGRYPASAESDGGNNGLEPTVQVLERIYTATDTSYPGRTPMLSASLQKTGKSRADLWAFATLVTVEYSAELNNIVCDSPDTGARYGQYHPREGEPDCRFNLPRPFVFKTGRSDCTPSDPEKPYATYRKESHPDPRMNGLSTVAWFKKYFGFNARESIAILGAHTLGRLSVIHGLYKYSWKAFSGQLFNNGYFRNLAEKRDWYYPTGGVNGKKVGDQYGNRPAARWLPHVRGDTVTGGPVQWLQEKLVCNNWNGRSLDMDTCEEKDLAWRFVVGIDETVLSCEMGLWRHFEVDSNGMPTGCRGLEKFNMEHWGKNPYNGGLDNYHYTWSTIDDRKAEPECPKQTYADAGDKPTHEIIEEFADDTQSWLSSFIPTLEKSLENGYQAGQLKVVSGGMSGFYCPPEARDNLQIPYACFKV